MSAPTTVPEVLRAAVEVLECDGWTQGTRRDRAGRMCALGAIHEAAFGLSFCLRFDSQIALHDYIGMPISVWNDTPGRTADEVKAALLQAAERAEADQ